MRMEHEPPAVPFYPDVVSDHWYCLECSSKSAGRLATANHWIVAHGTPESKPTDGVDITIGSHLLLMRARRFSWVEDQVEGFAGEMHEGFGADDFLAEAEIRDA